MKKKNFQHKGLLRGTASILLCTLISIIALFSLTACSNHVTIYNLENAYANKVLSNDDIKNIATLRNGSLQNFVEYVDGEAILETEEFTATKPSEILDDKTKDKIVKNFKAYIKERFKNTQISITIKECSVIEYYGSYNGYTVVEMDFTYDGLDLSDQKKDYIVNGIYLGKITEKQLIISYQEA